MTNELKVAIQAAKAASKISLKYFGHNPYVKFKADQSPVTKADKESEAIIRKIILKNFPNTNIVGEEAGGDLNKDEFWTIDPIDGTKYFIRDLPLWSILIALYKGGDVVLGISYMPVFNELIWAEKGKGAFLNGKKISVSKVSNLKEVFFNFGTLRKFNNHKNIFRLADQCLSSRGIGNPYGYQQVACGKMDISLDVKAGIWDLAPYKCIIEEAGGKITDFEGNPWKSTDKQCLATNGILHDEVIRILNEKN